MQILFSCKGTKLFHREISFQKKDEANYHFFRLTNLKLILTFSSKSPRLSFFCFSYLSKLNPKLCILTITLSDRFYIKNIQVKHCLTCSISNPRFDTFFNPLQLRGDTQQVLRMDVQTKLFRLFNRTVVSQPKSRMFLN